MSKHTPAIQTSKWLMAGNDFVYALNAHGENFFCVSVQRGKNDDHKRIDDTDVESIARLIAAAPELLEEIRKRVSEAEQCTFENWLNRVCPSGAVEEVKRQWESSCDYKEFIAEWGSAIALLTKATGE